MARAVEILGHILFWPVVVYGFIRGVMVFFEMKLCSGDQCEWAFAGWNPLIWGILFLGYLPFAPMVGMVLVCLYLIPGALCFVLAGRLKRNGPS